MQIKEDNLQIGIPKHELFTCNSPQDRYTAAFKMIKQQIKEIAPNIMHENEGVLFSKLNYFLDKIPS